MIKRYRTLSEIYADLPEVQCQGKCWKACSIIPMSNVERNRIRSRGVLIPIVAEGMDVTSMCPALGEDHRCTVYSDRPLICRMYGATEDMECPYHCEVIGARVTVETAHHMLNEARRIGNGSTVQLRRRKENLKKRHK